METPYQCAPGICVEVISPSHSQKEMFEKMAFYLEKGAREVWICKEDGKLSIYNASGRVDASEFFDDLPAQFDY